MKIKVEIDLDKGMFFKSTDGLYLLAMVGLKQYALVNVYTGNRLEDASSLEEIGQKIIDNKDLKYIGNTDKFYLNLEEIC